VFSSSPSFPSLFFLLFSPVLPSLFFSSILFPSLSISSLFFLCYPPCSALLSSFPMAPLCFFFFCVFLSLLPPVSIVSPSIFFLSSISPLFYLSLLPCFLIVTYPLSFLFSTPLFSAVHPLAFIARGCRRFPFVVAGTE